MEYLDGTIPRPNEVGKSYEDWIAEDHIIMSAVLHSVEKSAFSHSHVCKYFPGVLGKYFQSPFSTGKYCYSWSPLNLRTRYKWGQLCLVGRSQYQPLFDCCYEKHRKLMEQQDIFDLQAPSPEYETVVQHND